MGVINPALPTNINADDYRRGQAGGALNLPPLWASTKRSFSHFPFRTQAGGAQPMGLPPARAWRIRPVAAADMAAAVIPAVGGAPTVESAPAGALDGAFPVWVQLTDPTGSPLPTGPILVADDGLNEAPTGGGWGIVAAAASASGGAPGDQLCYIVETVQLLEEAGNPNPAPAASLVARSVQTLASPVGTGQAAAGLYAEFLTPSWARSASYLLDCMWNAVPGTDPAAIFANALMRIEGRLASPTDNLTRLFNAVTPDCVNNFSVVEVLSAGATYHQSAGTTNDPVPPGAGANSNWRLRFLPPAVRLTIDPTSAGTIRAGRQFRWLALFEA